MFDRQEEITQRNRPDPLALTGNIASYTNTEAAIQKLTKAFEADLKQVIDRSDWSESDKDSARQEINENLHEMMGEVMYYPSMRLGEMRAAE